MSGTARISNHGHKLETPRRYYRCAIGRDNSRPNCRTRSHQPAADIEAVVWNEVRAMLTDPTAFCDVLLEDSPAEADGLNAEILDAKRILRRIDEEEQRLVSLYIRGGFTQDNLEAEKQLLDERRAAAQAHLEGLTNRLAMRIDRSIVEVSVRAIQDAIDGDLDALDDTERKALVQRCIFAVTLDKDRFVQIGFNIPRLESEAELAALRVAPRLTGQVV